MHLTDEDAATILGQPVKRDWIKEMKEMLDKSGVKICIIPSPHRILSYGLEYTDYDTADYYRKWLESGKDLDSYYEHQKKGFPLFEERLRLENAR